MKNHQVMRIGVGGNGEKSSADDFLFNAKEYD